MMAQPSSQRAQLKKAAMVTLESMKPRVLPFWEQGKYLGILQSLLEALPDNQLGGHLSDWATLRLEPQRLPWMHKKEPTGAVERRTPVQRLPPSVYLLFPTATAAQIAKHKRLCLSCCQAV